MRKLLLTQFKAGSDYKAGSEYEETVAKKMSLTNKQVQIMSKMLLKIVSPVKLVLMVS